MITHTQKCALLGALIFGCFAPLAAHEYFFSKAEVSVSGNHLSGVILVNREDLFNACFPGKSIAAANDIAPDQRGKIIANYISPLVTIITSDNRVHSAIVDSVGRYSVTETAVWIHIDAHTPLATFDITNRILVAALPKQQNFMTIRFPCEKVSTILNKTQYRRTVINPCR